MSISKYSLCIVDKYLSKVYQRTKWIWLQEKWFLGKRTLFYPNQITGEPRHCICYFENKNICQKIMIKLKLFYLQSNIMAVCILRLFVVIKTRSCNIQNYYCCTVMPHKPVFFKLVGMKNRNQTKHETANTVASTNLPFLFHVFFICIIWVIDVL